ncbi:MAG: type II toxin-antitoxin system VapC family toxin [Acidobacteriota bacterium]
MSVYFFDSSALVKRYVRETGTDWVRAITDPAANYKIYIAEITGVEVLAAITRRIRTKSISKTDADTASKQFRYDFAKQYKVSEIPGSLIAAAMDLTENYQLRAYDAVQLAVALEIDAQIKSVAKTVPAAAAPTLTIVSSDDELNVAVIAEGLILEDPKNYP